MSGAVARLVDGPEAAIDLVSPGGVAAVEGAVDHMGVGAVLLAEPTASPLLATLAVAVPGQGAGSWRLGFVPPIREA
jgi:hypothetical protein